MYVWTYISMVRVIKRAASPGYVNSQVSKSSSSTSWPPCHEEMVSRYVPFVVATTLAVPTTNSTLGSQNVAHQHHSAPDTHFLLM
jgi:hypothetical protein